MKLRSVLALSLIMLLSAAVPALGAPRQATGDRIFLFAGDQDYPAATAFHIMGGWINERGLYPIGKATVSLDVDGVTTTATFRENTADKDALYHVYYWNFPNGMTGVHTFVARYWVPCGGPVDCAGGTPNTVVEVATFPATVTFVP